MESKRMVRDPRAGVLPCHLPGRTVIRLLPCGEAEPIDAIGKSVPNNNYNPMERNPSTSGPILGRNAAKVIFAVALILAGAARAEALRTEAVNDRIHLEQSIELSL